MKNALPTASRWMSFDLIFFDCDSTLSALEGIDELARVCGPKVFVEVETMTRERTRAEVHRRINELVTGSP